MRLLLVSRVATSSSPHGCSHFLRGDPIGTLGADGSGPVLSSGSPGLDFPLSDSRAETVELWELTVPVAELG